MISTLKSGLNDFCTVLINLANIKQEGSSRRGIECLARGATRVFEQTSCIDDCPQDVILAYTSAAKAIDEASQNPKSSIFVGLL